MKKRKILHGMVDVAGQGTYEVQGLKEKGIDAELVVWEKNRFAYSDYKSLNISRKPLLYPISLIKMVSFFVYGLFKYNIFHFHFSRSLLLFNFDLFWLKLFRKKVFMEYHGSDIRWQFYRNRPVYWPEEEVPGVSERSRRHSRLIHKYVDAYILHDAELLKHLPADDVPVYFLPLKLDISKFNMQIPKLNNDKLLIVHANSGNVFKGSKYIMAALDNLHTRYKFEHILVQNMTQEEAHKIFEKADIIIDQMFFGAYGVFALESMAMGKPIISYISDDMLEEYPEELPIQVANIDNIESVIEKLILDENLRVTLGRQGREYVETYHDYRVVTEELLNIYLSDTVPCSAREGFARIKELKERMFDEV